MKKLFAAALITATFTAGAGTAFAGEITGNGKLTPIKAQQEDGALAGPANSWCAFSGLNDDPDEDASHTQSWGTGRASHAPASEAALSGFIQDAGPGTQCQGGMPTAE